MLHTLRFSLKNDVYFIMLPFLVPVLFTFYIQSVLKFKCETPVPKAWNEKCHSCLKISMRHFTLTDPSSSNTYKTRSNPYLIPLEVSQISTLPPESRRCYFAIRHWFQPLRDVGTGLEPSRLFHQCHGLLYRCTLQISRLSAILLHYTV